MRLADQIAQLRDVREQRNQPEQTGYTPKGERRDLGKRKRLLTGWVGSRREFLGCSAALSLLPGPLRLSSSIAGALPLKFDSPQFSLPRLRPQYHSPGPLVDIIKKVDPERDDFPAEKFASRIQTVLRKWSEELLRSISVGINAIAQSLADDFKGASTRPVEERTLRTDTCLQVRRISFSTSSVNGRAVFLESFKELLAGYSALSVAQFVLAQIRIANSSPTVLDTIIRYEFVGEGPGIHREQRYGVWHISWRQTSQGALAVKDWWADPETRVRTTAPIFEEITAEVLAGNRSYTEQLRHGANYWRTVLDSASGIDVYGNNGIAAGDIDGDGYDDLYICQPSGLPNRLYRNRGDGTFIDITDAAGVGILDATPCALFVDVLNRGRQDLLVVTVTEPLLFFNEGNGTFRLKRDAFKFSSPPQGTFTGAAFGDYDRDGKLDLYLCLYSYYEGIGEYRYPSPYYDAQNGPPNFLFHNDGDGTFRDVTAASGMDQGNNRFTFDCHWCDYDGDGWPDLYVVNDFGRNNLYHNNGNGTFTDVAEQAGVLDIGPGMSACWFDYDNDGKPDLYVSDMWEAAGQRISNQKDFMPNVPEETRALYRRFARGNSLFHNSSGGKFEDLSEAAAVEISGWSWSCQDWDFDHDGYPDLYIANGFISGPDHQNLESFFWRQVIAQSPPVGERSQEYELGWDAINELIRSDGTWAGFQRNVFYVNNRDGTFTEAAGAVGLDFIDDSRAFALADFDHDGRLEVFLKNRTGPQLRILHNVAESIGESISFRLRGTRSNRDAIGTWITVDRGGLRQMKLLQAGSGFCSQHSKEVIFGLGSTTGPIGATVRWPSGLVSAYKDLPPGHRIEIVEGSEDFHAIPFARRPGRARPRNASQPAEQLPTTFGTWLIAPLDAPDFSLPDLAGNTKTLSTFRANPVLLNFWATWSQLSVNSLIQIQSKLSQINSSRLRILAISLDPSDGQARVRSLARAHQFSFPVLLGTEDVAAIYNLLFRYLFDRHKDLPIPTSFLIDERGSIARVYQGPIEIAQILKDVANIPRTAEERQRLALPFSGRTFGVYSRNYFTYGLVFAQHGYADAAEISFKRAIAQDPQAADAYYDLGTLYMQKEQWNQAKAMLEKAVQLKPDNLMGLNNLGIVAAQVGRPQEAEQYFKQVLKSDANNTLAISNLADLYRNQHRMQDAQQLLEAALKRKPEDPQLNYKLGMIFAGDGRNSEAQVYLERAVRLQPNNVQALDNLGVVYALTHQLDRAAETFLQCIQKAPKFDQPYLNLARVDISMGKRAEAAKVLKQLLEQVPDHALAQQYLRRLQQQ